MAQYLQHDGPINTFMMRNIPYRLTQPKLVELLNANGFQGRYDFLYVPSGARPLRKGGSNLGYGFINIPNARSEKAIPKRRPEAARCARATS